MQIKRKLKDLWQVTRKAVAAWWEADPFRQSAVIAYYAIFSIPALLVIIITVAGWAFGQDAIQGEVSDQIAGAVGIETANDIEEMIAKAGERKSSVWAAIISIVTLIFGATGVFAQMQTSLNQIWEVKAVAEKAWLKTIKDRLFSFGLIISIAFLLLISLVISSLLSAFGDWMQSYMPDFILVIFQLLNFIISLGVISVLFALMYKILPDAKVKWRYIWIGAIATSLLFTVGKTALGFYFGQAEPASTYGAAGSVVLIMLWVSYSCMIVFLGAEFTKQYATHHGKEIVPTQNAEKIETNEEEKLISEKKEAALKVE
jgi:membrane protein